MSTSLTVQIKKDGKNSKENKSKCDMKQSVSTEVISHTPRGKNKNKTVDTAEFTLNPEEQKRVNQRKMAKSNEVKNEVKLSGSAENAAAGQKPKARSVSKTRSISRKSAEEKSPKKKSEEEEKKEKEEKEKEQKEEELVEKLRREARARERKRRREIEEEKERMRRDERTLMEQTQKPVDEAEDKHGRKFNMPLATAFFKQMIVAQKSRAKSNDTQMEVMPDSRMLSLTISSSSGIPRRRGKLDKSFFRESGEPIWVDNSVTTNEVKTDDSSIWLNMVPSLINGELDAGRVPPPRNLNPYGPMKELEKTNEKYCKDVVLHFATVSNLYYMCEPAVQRWNQKKKEEEEGGRLLQLQRAARRAAARAKEREPKTAVVTEIRFNMNNTFTISYDRRRPILSINKFRKKYQQRLMSLEKGPIAKSPDA